MVAEEVDMQVDVTRLQARQGHPAKTKSLVRGICIEGYSGYRIDVTLTCQESCLINPPIDFNHIYAVGGQAPTVGMMPPSESDSYDTSSDEEEVKRRPIPGELPPNSSSSNSSSEDEGEARQPALRQEPVRLSRKEIEEREKMQEDMERLRLARERREAQRLERIEQEGWDRFAPLSDTNYPPGTVPPSKLV